MVFIFSCVSGCKQLS